MTIATRVAAALKSGRTDSFNRVGPMILSCIRVRFLITCWKLDGRTVLTRMKFPRL